MRRLAFVLLGCVAPLAAHAHQVGDTARGSWIETALRVGLWTTLLGGAALYVRGLAALWTRAGVGRGIRRGEVASFAIGWLVLGASLLSPIDVWSDRSFAVHMAQHELLMVVAAPLIVLGGPLQAWTWGVRPPVQRAFDAFVGLPIIDPLLTFLMGSLGAWLVHALALWVWHVPVLFKAALSDPLTHVLQHVSFFGSALAYWWSVFGGRGRRPGGGAIASLFTTMLHTSALGALLTFSSSAWYADDTMRAFGLSAAEDQQLGGLIMWVPGGLAYLIGGLMIVRQWLARGVSSAMREPSPASAVTRADRLVSVDRATFDDPAGAASGNLASPARNALRRSIARL